MAEPRPTHGKCHLCGTWQQIKFLQATNTSRLHTHAPCGPNQQPTAMIKIPRKQQRIATHRLLQDAHDASDKLAEQVVALTAQMAIVEVFVAERAQFVRTARGIATTNEPDYWRYNGHSEARRILARQLGLPVAWPAEDKQPTGGESA